MIVMSLFRSTNPLKSGSGPPTNAEPAGVRLRLIVGQDVGTVGVVADPGVDGLADQSEVTVVGIDDLIAVGVHAAADRRPREVGVTDVGIVRVGRVEDGRERAGRELRTLRRSR